ncbi:hypothetical protein ES702_03812 [subsurface metagenome]
MREFASQLIELDIQIGFKISARGWCYTLEGYNLITKAEFDIVENLINNCRRTGLLPIDFVAEEEARKFSGVEIPDSQTPTMYMRRYLNAALEAENYYTPDWWEGEKYYIQIVVEKIDLKTLFTPICKKFHIPIATGRGWSSMLQRAEYARRFKEAEDDKGLLCVLLYCGDHDPDGLRIDQFLRENLEDLNNIKWRDSSEGYNPESLDIQRFGLNYDFIIANDLTWIDNLITARRKNLADSSHPNFHLPYVQEYLKKYGARKCEANSLIIKPEEGRALCKQAIEEYLGSNAVLRFRKKREKVKEKLDEFRERTGLNESIREAIALIEEEEE